MFPDFSGKLKSFYYYFTTPHLAFFDAGQTRMRDTQLQQYAGWRKGGHHQR
jgi:hypothetical protein